MEFEAKCLPTFGQWFVTHVTLACARRGVGQCAPFWAQFAQGVAIYTLAFLNVKFGAQNCFQFGKWFVTRVTLACARRVQTQLPRCGDGQCALTQRLLI